VLSQPASSSRHAARIKALPVLPTRMAIAARQLAPLAAGSSVPAQ
jgi:hypothetical protein